MYYCQSQHGTLLVNTIEKHTRPYTISNLHHQPDYSTIYHIGKFKMTL